jgi:hypothetical protein
MTDSSNLRNLERWDLTEGSELRTSATIRNTGAWVRFEDVERLLGAAETKAPQPKFRVGQTVKLVGGESDRTVLAVITEPVYTVTRASDPSDSVSIREHELEAASQSKTTVPTAQAALQVETESERECALQDIAYRNGAQQALVIAHQSLEAADKWFADLWQRTREARAALKTSGDSAS